MTYIIQGLMIGFAYVASIGVQNLFVINTALTQRKQRVYLTALIIKWRKLDKTGTYKKEAPELK